jgi:uncharacterized cupredoxin-like copper-binding protein
MRLVPVLLAGLLTAACGSAARGPAPVRVVERDFRIAAPAQVRAGAVSLAVRNRGPVAHELIVVKVGRAPLPLRRDGLTVDEDAVQARTAAALEPQPTGRETILDARLTPGRYELFCNMAGHYRGGMHTELVVR